MTRVLYLHGMSAGPLGRKRHKLAAEPGFSVHAPALPFPSFGDFLQSAMMPEAGDWCGYHHAREIAQAAADDFQPDVIVGSSMGGAVALGVNSAAARVLIAPATRTYFMRLPGLPREWQVPARTVILHARGDLMVPCAASIRLLEEATRAATPEEAAAIRMIGRRLEQDGYATLQDRLVRIGKDHQCNEPDPRDTWNRDGDPHRAMIRAIRIVADLADGRA